MRHRIFSVFFTLSLFLFSVSLKGKSYGPIYSADDLNRILKTVKAGDTILIADGRHDGWSSDLAVFGTADHPVTIRPESSGGVTFTGNTHFAFSGSYINLTGFVFDGCKLEKNLLEFQVSEHCRIENSTFQNSGGQRAVIGIKAGARSNTVLGCRFINIAARCINLNISEDIYTLGIPAGNVIRGNHFQDIPPANRNGRETIKIGTNQPTYGHVQVKTLVEDNTFLRCDGEAEIISNKCAGNIYRRNVFEHCKGELVMRGGRDCLIEGNRFTDCAGGIRICGTGHMVRNNVIVDSRGTGIRLFYGMTEEQGGHYQAAVRCVLSNNTIVNAKRAGILVGDAKDKDWKEKGIQNVPPAKNQIINNLITGVSGDLLIVHNAPQNSIDGNLFHKRDSATISAAGLNALYADPRFRNPEDGDYRPQKDSPALTSIPPKGASLFHFGNN